MLNKLRSSGLTARDQELLKQHRSPSPEKKSKETVDDKGVCVLQIFNNLFFTIEMFLMQD